MDKHIIEWATAIINEAIIGKLIELGECTTRPDHVDMTKVDSDVRSNGGGDKPGHIHTAIHLRGGKVIDLDVYVTE